MRLPFLTYRAALCGCLFFACASGFAQEPEAPTRIKAEPVNIPGSTDAKRWMIVAANRYASEAGADILRKGGSAVDAAIAAQWVLNLVEPQSSGIGGGGFMLTWHQKTQKLQAWDGRETAPSAGRIDDYRDAEGKALPFADVVREGKAVGVPGLTALLWQTHAQHGKLPWNTLFEPAINLAENGFFVSPRLQSLLENDKLLKEDVHAAELYYPNDKAVQSGIYIRNPALAQTLRKLASSGNKGFYQGDMPRQIIAAIRNKTGSPSRLQESDFQNYRAVERAPVCSVVLKMQVCGMPPPSAGGIAVLQMLQLLEMQHAGRDAKPLLRQAGLTTQWNVGQLGPWMTASRLAYEDRLRHVGDPDRVDVPVARLISQPYLQQRLTGFSLSGALPARDERPSTTHLSVVDAEGNAVALTSSIEDQFGSRIMVNGFLLNNQLTDFDLRPPQRGAAPGPNAFEPGKRPRSSMAPTIVLSNDKPQQVLGIIGSPGGPQIPSYIASRLYAHWWGSHAPAQSVAAPHITLRESRLDIESGQLDMISIKGLRDVLPAGPGRDDIPVNLTPQTSGIAWIIRTQAGWQGVADPRREGVALGD